MASIEIAGSWIVLPHVGSESVPEGWLIFGATRSLAVPKPLCTLPGGSIPADPNFSPPRPDAGGGEGGKTNLVVNAQEYRQYPAQTNSSSSYSSGPSSAGATGGETGLDYVGLDVTFI